MEKVNLIVDHATLVTMDPDGRVLQDYAIVVKGSLIAALEPSASVLKKYESPKVIDGRDQYVFPGFINTHTHLFQNGLKGLGRDKLLFDWLDSSVRKALHEIRYPDVYNAAAVGCIENMRSGVTTVMDYMYAHGSQLGLDDAVVQAFDETGMRGILGRTHTKTDNLAADSQCAINETEDMFFKDIERLRGKLGGHERITLALAPGIIWDMSEEGYRKLRQYADRYGLRITMHLDETEHDDVYAKEHYGINSVELLDRNGVLGEDFIGVHLVHLDEKSLDILQKRRIKCSHNPVSNMILASGVAPIPELKKRGLDVGLGTDGAASNDTQNMLEVIKTTAILHKCVHRDATLFPAMEVLKMATIDGARVVGREKEIGSLEVGKKADFFLFNPRNVACVPVADPIACLVYSANPVAIDTVVIHGRVVLEKGEILSIDEKAAIYNLQESAYRLRERVGLGSTFNGRKLLVLPFHDPLQADGRRN
ncbi:MAG TPA: amidohydrolase [Anaerolineales bacterium]|nr:amidohydrolase [Anaerolineales bacterium]